MLKSSNRVSSHRDSQKTLKVFQPFSAPRGPQPRSFNPVGYLFALVGVGSITALIRALQASQASASLSNVDMLYLLVVIVAAVYFGRVSAIFASLLSVLAADYFFVEPLYTFTVADYSEWLALGVFLLVATVTGQLTARLRLRAHEALQHDVQMTTLAETSWEIASELDARRAMSFVLHRISELLELPQLAVIVRNSDEINQIFMSDGFSLLDAQTLLLDKHSSAVNFVFERALPLGPSINRFPNAQTANEAYKGATAFEDLRFTLMPITYPISHKDGSGNVFAVLYLDSPQLEASSRFAGRREQQILSALINHVGLLLQRDKSMKAEAKAQAILEADQMKTALLAMVSHDFRSPLTSIKATIQTLKSTAGELAQDEQENLLEAVDGEVDRINRMVTNILDLSRLEAGAWRPKLESMPVSEIVGMVLSGFNAKDNARILIDNSAGASSFMMDSVQIAQVLHNLLENALKYSPPQSQIELIVAQTSDTLIFEICDRGKGLVAGDEEHLFEPFYRGRSLSESNVPGVGIGLAICHGLVTAHGGKIAAESREGGGAKFRVTLPV